MGVSIMETAFPSLKIIQLMVSTYKKDVFERLLPQEGVVQFPQLVNVTINLPPKENIVETSLCNQRMLYLFPNCKTI